MTEADFIEMIEEILEVEKGTVSLGDSLDVLGWDSLCNITFVAEVDTRIGASIDADRLSQAATVGDLRGLIDADAEAE